MSKRNLWLRYASQTVFLLLWVFLFWQTATPAVTFIESDLFLITDPMVGILAMTAARTWIATFLYSLIFVGLTILLGRFFCGWVCPLGTVFDVVGRLWKGRQSYTLKNDEKWRRVKYYILAAMIVGAVLGSNILLWFDPLVLFFRGIAMGFPHTGLNTAAFLTAAILILIILLNGITHRFWCRYLCPLGAFYAVFSRFSFVRRRLKQTAGNKCDGCKHLGDQRECQDNCSMGASLKKQGSPDECIRCMKCGTVCHVEAPHYPISVPLPAKNEHLVALDRRTFMTSIGAGAVLSYSAVHARKGDLTESSKFIVRPPMVTDEAQFLALCVRCGQCIRACPEGALQPLALESGITGFWSPAIAPEVAGCKTDCNSCSLVCPTQAISAFKKERTEKWALKMGQVTFSSQKCISYEPGAHKPCLKCVEVCPNKAIVVDNGATPERPVSVLYDRCTGCGLCETACREVTPGVPAMRLTNDGRGLPVLHVKDPTPKLPKH